jgi:predicted nucleic acid-binding protein
MVLHYLDTSALAKRYIQEPGSDWVRKLVDSEDIAVSELVIVESASALARRTREGNIPANEADTAFQLLMTDMRRFTVLAMTQEILRDAATLLLRRAGPLRLRSLDAIHVATAEAAFRSARDRGIEVGAFVTADRALSEAIRSIGLATLNPEDYR